MEQDHQSQLDKEFFELVEILKQRTDLTDKESISTRLELYGLGKQGKFGDNTEAKPGFFDIVGKKKWDAWTSKKGMDVQEVRTKFVEIAKNVLAKETAKK